jgi:hypothetical protein
MSSAKPLRCGAHPASPPRAAAFNDTAVVEVSDSAGLPAIPKPDDADNLDDMYDTSA